MRLMLIEDHDDFLVWQLEDYENQYIIGKDDGTGDDLYLGNIELYLVDNTARHSYVPYKVHEHVKGLRAQVGWVPNIYKATVLIGLTSVNEFINLFRNMPENWHVRDLS